MPPGVEGNDHESEVIMKVRLTALLSVLVTVLTAFAAPAASAAASSHHSHMPSALHRAPLAGRPDVLGVNGYWCQPNSNECLNVILCNPRKGVQLWNFYNGGNCSGSWHPQDAGNVDPSTGYPFYCGSGLNSKFAGDSVYFIDYAAPPNYTAYVPVSAGFDATVTLTPYNGNSQQGMFVAQDNNGANSTRLIDVYATCQNPHHYIQHLFAGCGYDGCLVRDGLNPATGEYWDAGLQPL
jgi:hypothetical protein